MNYPNNSNLTLDATRHLSSYTPTHFQQQQQQYNSNNTMLQRPQTPLYSAAAASTMDIPRSTLSPSTGYYLSPSPSAALANNQQQQLPAASWGVSSLSPLPFSRNSMTNRIPGLTTTTTAMAAPATSSLSPTTHHQLMKPLAATTATSPMMGFMVGPISPSATATIAPTAVAPDSAFKLSKFLQRSASKQSPLMTTMMPQQQQQLQSQAQQQQQYSFSFSSPAPTMTPAAAATTATTAAAETKDTPPPTESITDLLTLNAPITLDSGSSSKPSSAAAAAAVSKQYWVRIFGFPSSKISIVLSDFSALCGGRILNHVSSEGNWVDVAFDSESARMKALERNGQMLDSLKHFVIGVLKLSDDVHGSSSHVDSNNSISGSDERAVPKRLYMIKRPNDIVMSDERGEQTLKRKRSMYDDEPTTDITASSSALLTTMADERPLKRQRSFFYQMLENIFKF